MNQLLDIRLAMALFTFAVMSLTPAFAQRQPNLNLAHYWGKAEGAMTFIKDNDAIVIDGGNEGTYFLQWRIVNNGATASDTIAVSDTVKVRTSWTTYKITWGQGQFANGMKQQDTVFISPAVNPVVLPLPAGLPASQDSVLTQWCDSVYFISGESTNPAIEADTVDNKICDTVFVTYWRTHIKEEIGGNGIMLYPNPASGRLHVKSLRYKITSLQTIDATGNIIHRQVVDSPGDVSLDVALLPPGLYLLQLFTSEGIVTERFLIR